MSQGVHVFTKSLAVSNAYTDAPWWEQVYRRTFPNFATMSSVRDDGWAQRGGIDRVITLASGKTVTVDEKVRKEDWPDILWEFYSDVERKTPGWCAKDLACDYIAYAFIPTQICILLPALQVRKAWIENCHKWMQYAKSEELGFKIINAKNEGWTTRSLAVPTDVTLAAIRDALIANWD